MIEKVDNIEGMAKIDLTGQINLKQIRMLVARSQWWSENEIAAYQSQCLQSLLTHASRTVPFYKERLQQALSDYSENSSHLFQLKSIPPLTRTDLQDHLEELTSSSVPSSHLPIRQKSTSGSTGQPVTTYNTQLRKMFMHSERLRWNNWRGMKNGDKVAELLTERTSSNINATTWGEPGRAGPLASFSASNPISSQIDWLQAEQPDFICTLPSNLDALLDHCIDNSITLKGVKGVSTQAEILRDEVRRKCEKVLGVRIMDSYGSRELGYIALECPERGHYHIQSNKLIIEVLNEEGNDCQPGETGKILITNLTNYASPLIRYEINDHVELGNPCSCGRGFPVIKKILGRSRNMFFYPSGDRFWPIISESSGKLARRVPAIKQIQLVQDKLDEITIRLVVRSALQTEEENEVKKTYSDALGDQFNFRIEYTDSMSSDNGKFEDAICNIKP
jgi:phenylacetate-CoA ligase